MYVVCIVSLLCRTLGIHLEVHNLYFTHMFAGVIVQVEVNHQVSPPSPGWFVEAVLDSTHRHLLGSEDIIRNGRHSILSVQSMEGQ